VLQQLSERNAAFARFLDLFNQRFLALFFRSWGDSRPIVHSDQPENDRFAAYVGSVMGVGSPAFDRAAGVPEGVGLYAGLLGPTVKSASRLRRAIQGLFGVTAEIDEFVGTWLEFEESERSMLGDVNVGLGVDFVVGVASYSVQDKVRVRIHVSGMEQYGRFLPDGDDADALADLVLFYVGQELDWDMEIAVPTSAIAPTRLGDGARLGWTSWMAPNYPRGGHRCDARFHPVAQREQNRRKSETSRR
jgi:type VI secretion system protein ImpH